MKTTNKINLSELINHIQKNDYIIIKRAGDGNCALNSLGSSLFAPSIRRTIINDFNNDPAYQSLLRYLALNPAIKSHPNIPTLTNANGAEFFEAIATYIPDSKQRQNIIARALRNRIVSILCMNRAHYISENATLTQAYRASFRDYMVKKINQSRTLTQQIKINEGHQGDDIFIRIDLIQTEFARLYEKISPQVKHVKNSDGLDKAINLISNELLAFWKKKDGAFDLYCKNVAKEGAQLGDIELGLIAQDLRLNLTIFETTCNENCIVLDNDRFIEINVVKDFTNRSTITIVHNSNHYDLAVNSEDATQFFCQNLNIQNTITIKQANDDVYAVYQQLDKLRNQGKLDNEAVKKIFEQFYGDVANITKAYLGSQQSSKRLQLFEKYHQSKAEVWQKLSHINIQIKTEGKAETKKTIEQLRPAPT